jgi:hypothetical protein
MPHNHQRVQGAEFEWNQTGKKDCGFIAQEVFNTYPVLRPNLSTNDVDEPVDSDGTPIYHSIDYGRMTPFLWQGMREILQRLDCVEAENGELKKRVALLESLYPK